MGKLENVKQRKRNLFKDPTLIPHNLIKYVFFNENRTLKL
jgi:nitrate reductase cytochrome c-type subunit